MVCLGFEPGSAWDSNLGPQDGVRRRNHGAMAATHHKQILENFDWLKLVT